MHTRNVTCQINESLLFSNIAPIIVGDNLCFLFTKEGWVTEVQAYRTITTILNNNISHFVSRYGLRFQDHFKDDFTIQKDRLFSRNFYVFAVNKKLVTDEKGTLNIYNEAIPFRYVKHPEDVPIYGYHVPSYFRERVNLRTWSTITDNFNDIAYEQGIKNRIRNFFNGVFSYNLLS